MKKSLHQRRRTRDPRKATSSKHPARRGASAPSMSETKRILERLARSTGHDNRSPIRRRVRDLGSAAVPALVECLSHHDEFMRWEAVNLLGDIADPDSLKSVVRFALSEDEVHAKWRSFWAVTRFDPSRSVPLLIKHLSGKNWSQRWSAALILSMLDRREAGPVIAEGLRVDDDWVRWEALSAAKALRLQGVEKAVAACVKRRVPDHLRREAVLALGAIGSSSAITVLRRVIRDRDPEVRWRAAMGLTRCQDAASVPAIHKQLKAETDPNVKKEFEICIRQLEGKT